MKKSASCINTLHLQIWFCLFLENNSSKRSYGTCKKRFKVSMRFKVRDFYGTIQTILSTKQIGSVQVKWTPLWPWARAPRCVCCRRPVPCQSRLSAAFWCSGRCRPRRGWTPSWWSGSSSLSPARCRAAGWTQACSPCASVRSACRSSGDGFDEPRGPVKCKRQELFRRN